MLGYVASDILATPRLLFAFALALTGSFTELAVLAALSSAALYIVGCAAALQLRRPCMALAGEPLDFPGLLLASLIGVGSMLIVIALASRVEILGLATLMAPARRTRTALQPVQRTQLMAVWIAQIRQVQLADAALSDARRFFTGGATRSEAGRMPGISLSR